jgi:hypothetical protein
MSRWNPGLKLCGLYPVRVVYTLAGVQGYAIHAYNEHSETWQPIGQVRTGPRAWQEIHLDKMEMLAELEQQAVESEGAQS